MNTRRAFLAGAAVTMASASVSRHALAGLPEPVIQASPNTQDPLFSKKWSQLQPCCHAQWLDIALAYE